MARVAMAVGCALAAVALIVLLQAASLSASNYVPSSIPTPQHTLSPPSALPTAHHDTRSTTP